jgi:hypothetical protein
MTKTALGRRVSQWEYARIWESPLPLGQPEWFRLYPPFAGCPRTRIQEADPNAVLLLLQTEPFDLKGRFH